jgi:excinuclease UvrABC nuclease subunit
VSSAIHDQLCRAVKQIQLAAKQLAHDHKASVSLSMAVADFRDKALRAAAVNPDRDAEYFHESLTEIQHVGERVGKAVLADFRVAQATQKAIIGACEAVNGLSPSEDNHHTAHWSRY